MKRYTARARPCPEGCETIPIMESPGSGNQSPVTEAPGIPARQWHEDRRRKDLSRPGQGAANAKPTRYTKDGLEWETDRQAESGIPLRDLRALCGSNPRSDFDSLAGKRNQPRRNQRAQRNETSHQWYGSVSAQSATAENEKPLRTCSQALSSSSRPTAIRPVGAELGSIGVEKP